MRQRLAVVAVGREAGALDDGLDLAVEHRDLARRAAVGGGGEEAGEQPLTRHVALGIEGLDAEHVHRHVAMDGRAGVGLGDQQQLGLAQVRAHLGRHALLVAHAAENAQVEILEDAERAAVDDLVRGLLALAGHGVFAIAEEGEVVVLDPLQEARDLGALVFVHRQLLGIDLLDGLVQARAHLAEVADRDAHVVQHRFDAALDLFQFFRLRHLGGADLHHRFGGRVRLADLGDLAGLVARDVHDRMHDQMNVEVLARQLGGHRIHQERHVVVHDLDHGVAGPPAMLILMRIEDADLGHPRLTLVGELPEREGGAEQVFRRFLRDVRNRHIGVELPDEGLGLSLARAFDPSADEADDLVHQLLFQGFGFHDCPDLGVLSRALHGSGSGRARRSSSATPLTIPGE